MLFRRFAMFLVVATVAGSLLSGTQDAEAARATIKFWAAEYRVFYTPGETTTDKKGNEIVGEPTVKLTIRGRASAYGGDKVDFKWTEPNGSRWLDVLQVCGGGNGKLQGNISSQVDQNERGIEGSGPIDDLNCRVILK